MTMQQKHLAPLPEPYFRARYWRACGTTAYPKLPLTLTDADTLTEQKIINNVIALSLQTHRQNMALNEQRVRETFHRDEMRREMRRLKLLVAAAFTVMIPLMIMIGLLWRAAA